MPTKRKPAYLLHQASGQARVRIDGKDHYLGPFGSQESRDRYDDLVADWLVRQDAGRATLTIDELALLYVRFAESYYVKAGKQTAEVACVRSALRPLVRLFGTIRVREFTPTRLKAVRQAMIDAGLCRTTINQQVERIRRMYRWAVGEDQLPPAVYEGLKAVTGLRKGKTQAREPEPVMPVPDDVVDATLAHLPAVVADMVRFQRLTGCRPGEVCRLRPCDLDRTAATWVLTPASHKTEHHDRKRQIFIGPQAQAILLPYLLRSPEACCFSPADSERRRREDRHASRKTPLNQGNRPGQSQRVICGADFYTKDSYCRAIARACEVAFDMPSELRVIPKKASQQVKFDLRRRAGDWRALHCWTPNQLRHAAATQIRRQFGLEAAQAVLGHSTADVTQIYAERDQSLAAVVAKEIG